MQIVTRVISLLTIAGLLACSTAAQAMLINGDFQTGNLNGWTTFTTTNGTLGGTGYPTVTSFDTTGNGASLAATFNVGEVIYTGDGAGGGIFQSVVLAAGNYSLSADIAAFGKSNPSNDSGGIFDLLFDGLVVDSVDFGDISFNTVERSLIASVGVATAGSHEVRIRLKRPWITSGNTPIQYIDNVVLQGATNISVPAPATLALLGLGLAALGFSRRKRMLHS